MDVTIPAAEQPFSNQSSSLTIRRSFWMFWILVVGFVLRSVCLEIKPVHFDEGINGHFVATLWRDGYYHYDPTNFHGPLYFYILALAERLFGFGIFSFRFVTGLLQLGVLYVVGLHRRFVGNIAIWAALIICLSPAFVFYSRYAIHESLFILAQVSFSYGYFLYREERSARSLWWMSLSAAALITTKETFFIFLCTWAIAVTCLKMADRFFPQLAREPKTTSVSAPPEPAAWTAAFAVSAIAVLALFTGFFVFPQGARDMITALTAWTKTGSGHTGHEKSFWYWLDLFRLYEWPALAGLIAAPVLFFFVNRPMRILALVTVGTWLAYSIIPYKTPWLILNLLWPAAFCAGAVINRATPSFKHWRGMRTGAAIAVFATIFFSSADMLRLNFRDFAKRDEPYVYVQSTTEFKVAIDHLFSHLKRRPEDRSMKIYVLNRDPWPLPWMLLPFTNTTWGRANVLGFADGDVILSDSEDRQLIEEKLLKRYFVLPFQIRDSYQNGQAYFLKSKYESEMPIGTSENTPTENAVEQAVEKARDAR